jgi:hypothetical protein
MMNTGPHMGSSGGDTIDLSPSKHGRARWHRRPHRREEEKEDSDNMSREDGSN